MKRLNNCFEKIYDYENLRIAFLKAAKGKSKKKNVIAFRHNFDENMERLRQQLITETPDIGHYTFFKIYDPKERMICAASFPERVLHHAIMNICEPRLDAYAIFDSYACRKGKGSHKALARAQEFARKNIWYLKLDIRKYFNSIDHVIMMNLLERQFKDQKLLALFEKILNTYHTDAGKGVPIGNLISQHLANFYLGVFDHWIKVENRIKWYIRYMDDFLIFGPSNAFVKEKRKQIRQYLDEKLALAIKQDGQLNRCANGIPFLGFRVFPDQIRLAPVSKKRFIRKFKLYEKKWQSGEWTEETLARHTEPLIAFTQTADATAFRRRVIEQFGVSS